MCRAEHPPRPSGGKVGLCDLAILQLSAISAGNFSGTLSILML